MTRTPDSTPDRLSFRGGWLGAILPFIVFLAGVAWLGLSGAPDERGFWPFLIAGLACGLLLSRDRTAYAEAVLAGMSRPIVLLMVMAWLLAGVLASLLSASGLVDSLIWLSQRAGLTGGGYVVAAFLLCAVVSTATGTSLGTLLLCAPLVFPAGIDLGASPAVLIGAILGGATFGDNISPISDTTIASAMTQEADLGGVVVSRLRYAVPVAIVAMVVYGVLGGTPEEGGSPVGAVGSPQALPMILVPVVVIAILLAREHLLTGLMTGVVAAAGLALVLGLIQLDQLVSIDPERFGARGLVVEGIERGLGISVFTVLLAGLVAGIEGSGLVDLVVARLGRRARTERGAEGTIFASVSAAVLLTTHSVVAILTVGRLARRLGRRFGVRAYRRANILDVTVCTYPFLLPYMIPTILAASTTAGADGVPMVSAFDAGLHNFHSWGLLLVVLVAIVTGYGRQRG